MSAEGEGETPAAKLAGGDLAEITLRHPVRFGSEVIEKLTLRPLAKHLRDFALPMKGEGENAIILFQPYELAKAGLKMADVAGAQTVLDKLHVADMWELAQVVFGFINGGPATGSGLSQ